MRHFAKFRGLIGRLRECFVQRSVCFCSFLVLFPFSDLYRFRCRLSTDFLFASVKFGPKMVSRLLIGDNNLSKFWPAFQFARPSLKHSVMVTATDLDGLDHALSQTEEKEQVIVSVLTSILLEEINQDDISGSAFNVCEQAVSRLLGLCPRVPSCQVYLFEPGSACFYSFFNCSFCMVCV